MCGFLSLITVIDNRDELVKVDDLVVVFTVRVPGDHDESEEGELGNETPIEVRDWRVSKCDTKNYRKTHCPWASHRDTDKS